jgi:hypothetical protein
VLKGGHGVDGNDGRKGFENVLPSGGNESYEVASNGMENIDSYEVAKEAVNVHRDHGPMASCVVQFVQKQVLNGPFLLLFDAGLTRSWFNSKVLPKGAVPTVGKPQPVLLSQVT